MKKSIGMKSVYGKYTSFTKEFNNQRHLNNWIGYMERKGHKIIGVHDN